MKLKQSPEDFRVEELTSVQPGAEGKFALYRLEKRGWTTLDAVQAIRRRWKLDQRRLSFGGMKDRHAHTVQFLSIFHGPKRRLTHHEIALEYLGQVPAAYTSTDIRGNRFDITLRHLSGQESATARQALEEVRAQGVPNYFDDQRFGSVIAGGEFVARLMVLGKYEEALRLALTAPYEHDRSGQKKEKSLVLAHWAEWPALKEKLPRCHARSLVDYLVHHPADFRGALARLRPELRGLYLSAFQSFLWNQMLALWLQQHCRPDQLMPVQLRLGAVPMHRGLASDQLETLSRLTLPLPTARLHLDPADPNAVLMETVLRHEGLEVGQLKLKGFREMFFSRGERAALCLPVGIKFAFAADDKHPGREKLKLCFELARGNYATLIVKRITLGGQDDAEKV